MNRRSILVVASVVAVAIIVGAVVFLRHRAENARIAARITEEKAREARRQAISDAIRGIPKIPVEPVTDVTTSETVEGSETVRKGRASNTTDSLIAFDPLAGVLWPGAIIQGKSLSSGTLAAFGAVPRTPITITLTNLGLRRDTGSSLPLYSRTLSSPSHAQALEAIQDMLSTTAANQTAAKLSYDMRKFYSLDQAMMHLGLSASWLSGSVRASLDSSSYSRRTNLMIKLVQTYYTVSAAEPSSPASMFADGVRPEDLSPYLGADNPPGYVASVTYGRMLVFMFSSAESEDSLKGALNAAFNSGVNHGSITIDAAQKQVLQHSEVRAFVLGGNTLDALGLLSGDVVENLNKYLVQGANYSATSPGVPIAYQVCYLSDNTLARLSYTTTYEIRTAIPVKAKHYRVEFVYLDVYGDGSKGKDCWSTWCTINGQRHQMWNHQPDISDDCTKGNGPGPSGDRDSCRYPISDSFVVEVLPGDSFEVAFEGTAHDNNVPVRESKMRFDASNNWGIGGNGHQIPGKTLNRMGNYTPGSTEYYVFFNVTRLD